MAITKTQTLSPNQSGKTVSKNSYVQFKTWIQNNTSPVHHTGNLSENPFSQDITKILLQMKSGEKVQLKVQNDQNEEQIILELAQVRDGQESLQNHHRAQNFKNQGNQQVKLKKFQRAAQFYEQGLTLVQYDCSPESQPIKISLMSNLTLAYLKTNKYQECLNTCNQFLTCSLEPNKKVVHRKATANKNLKNYVQAENDIKFGLEICQNDEEGKKEFDALADAIKKQKKIETDKQKKVYSKMFG